MENQFRAHENRNPSQLPAPRSHSSNSSSSSGNCNGVHPTRPVTRSEINPCPTTFVQANSASFKQVVQMLTGSSDTVAAAAAAVKAPSSDHPPQLKNPIPPLRAGSKKPHSGFKLCERRNSLKGLKICPPIPGLAQGSGFSPRNLGNLSPGMLDFPSLALSPVTPLTPDPFNRPGAPALKPYPDLEERAITEKGFFLHPSPATTPRESEPRLLPLFPVTSPKVSGSSCS